MSTTSGTKLNNHIEEHGSHDDELKENRTILDFYNEHKQFFLVIASMDGTNIKLTLRFPECYEYGCRNTYSFKDLCTITTRLGTYTLLENQVTKFSNQLNESFEGTTIVKKDILNEFIKEDECVKDITIFPKSYGVIRIFEYFYLRKLINNYKDTIEILEEINRNAQNKLTIDIKKEVNQLKNIKEDKDIKAFVLKDNNFFTLIKRILGGHSGIQGVENASFHNIRNLTKALATELGITVHLHYKVQIVKQKDEHFKKIEFTEESKSTSKGVFPNLDDDILSILVQDVIDNSLWAYENSPYSLPQICKHLIGNKNSPDFTKEDSISVRKQCKECKKWATKRQFIEGFRNMCMNCLMLIGLKKNREELQCCHKFCIDCFKAIGVRYENEVFCLVCSSLSILYV